MNCTHAIKNPLGPKGRWRETQFSMNNGKGPDAGQIALDRRPCEPAMEEHPRDKGDKVLDVNRSRRGRGKADKLGKGQISVTTSVVSLP